MRHPWRVMRRDWRNYSNGPTVCRVSIRNGASEGHRRFPHRDPPTRTTSASFSTCWPSIRPRATHRRPSRLADPPWAVAGATASTPPSRLIVEQWSTSHEPPFSRRQRSSSALDIVSAERTSAASCSVGSEVVASVSGSPAPVSRSSDCSARSPILARKNRLCRFGGRARARHYRCGQTKLKRTAPDRPAPSRAGDGRSNDSRGQIRMRSERGGTITVGLITRRSRVRIPPPLLNKSLEIEASERSEVSSFKA